MTGKTCRRMRGKVCEFIPEGAADKTLLVDFEKESYQAAQAALQYVEDINVGGRWFHFAAALWKRVQKLGLAS
eukprot:5168755-Pyramimonas_sp.AAC.1